MPRYKGKAIPVKCRGALQELDLLLGTASLMMRCKSSRLVAKAACAGRRTGLPVEHAAPFPLSALRCFNSPEKHSRNRSKLHAGAQVRSATIRGESIVVAVMRVGPHGTRGDAFLSITVAHAGSPTTLAHALHGIFSFDTRRGLTLQAFGSHALPRVVVAGATSSPALPITHDQFERHYSPQTASKRSRIQPPKE